MRIAYIPAILISTLSLVACGESVSGSEPPAPDDTTTTTAAVVPATLAGFEGAWQCDVQRFAFADLSEQSEMLAERLDDAGYTEEAYEAFKVELAADPELRVEVKAAYDIACPGDGGGLEGESVPVEDSDS